MRKFKIKNRRKRKYVKKNELAASFSSTQTLAVGLVPLLLMAIAFFTTVLMYSPGLSDLQAPDIRLRAPSIPEVSLPTVELPRVEIPTVELPKIEIPQMKITLPTPIPYFAMIGATVVSMIDSLTQTFLLGMESVRLLMVSISAESVSFGELLAKWLDPMPVFVAVGDFTLFLSEQIVLGISSILITTSNAIVTFVSAIVYGVTIAVVTTAQGLDTLVTVTIATIENLSLTLQKFAASAVNTIGNWTTSTVAAIIHGWNAFVWFIGTPFRAIHHYFTQLSIIMAPFVTYVGDVLNRTSADLAMGAESLGQATNYVTNSVGQPSAQNK